MKAGMTLEARAFAWLRFEKRCPIVLWERSPRYCGRPDVVGVTKDRYLVEIEIKRTVGDFRANADKWHVRTRNLSLPKWPRLFWFAVPRKLVEKVSAELPEYAGLLTADELDAGFLEVVKRPTANTQSRRLSIKEAIRCVECQSNQLWAMIKRDAPEADLGSIETKPMAEVQS